MQILLKNDGVAMNRLSNIIKLENKPRIEATSSVVGKKEMEGPLSEYYDLTHPDERFGAKTFEQAESEMVRMAFEASLKKAGITANEVDLSLGGDLQNQCVAQSFGLSQEKIPYVGLYGACSNMAEGLMLGGILINSNKFKRISCSTSSHFAASERQFRFPLEYGCQRPQTSQCTVTGAGCFILTNDNSSKTFLNEVMPGIITDAGIKDANNMGAAMAEAGLNTLERYFLYSDMQPSDFDLIITGDLGHEGSEILKELAYTKGINLSSNYCDCGCLIYNREKQDVHSGGSGCGCSAVVMASYVYKKLESGELKDVLFIGTGALLSSGSVLQKLSIPGIAHLVRITREV